MTIGIPRSLLYHQYGSLWESFFTELGCDIALSPITNEAIFKSGTKDSISECCLPSKVHMGHIQSLLGSCDYILSPYATRENGGDAICTRFWGMGDVIRHTYSDALLLECAICEGDYSAQYKSFYQMGKTLGKSSVQIRRAYDCAILEQARLLDKKYAEQAPLLLSKELKVLLAGRPYVLHDPYISGAITNILSELEVRVLYSDHFSRSEVLPYSHDISPRLCWSASRESIGAIAAHKDNVDGVLMLTVFPCASDALACDMSIRTINDVPIALILLDGLQAEAGLHTRLESFIDIISERKSRNEQ